jgi:RNA polymerase sigma-70 factor, ECF subfamily
LIFKYLNHNFPKYYKFFKKNSSYAFYSIYKSEVKAISVAKITFSDSEQNRAINLGDFIEVVKYFQSPLLKFSHYNCRYSAIDPEDAVQETFVRLHNTLKKGECKITNAKTWLFTTLRNFLIDESRKIKHRKNYRENQINADLDTTTPENDLLENMIKDEAKQKAIYHLNQLDDVEKQIIQLKAIQNLKLREVAEIMGLSIGKVSYLLNKGLKSIANNLTKDGIA